jgi:hypothetical protein
VCENSLMGKLGLHGQIMATHIRNDKSSPYDISQKKKRKIMRKTVTMKKYWLIYIFAHVPVMSMVNITRGAEPMGKVTINVHILESVLS